MRNGMFAYLTWMRVAGFSLTSSYIQLLPGMVGDSFDLVILLRAARALCRLTKPKSNGVQEFVLSEEMGRRIVAESDKLVSAFLAAELAYREQSNIPDFDSADVSS